MSQSPKMIDCPACSRIVLLKKSKVSVSTGEILRYNGGVIIKDICDRCGGSGRILERHQKMFDRKTIILKKQQKQSMKEWIALEKELVYGVKDNDTSS